MTEEIEYGPDPNAVRKHAKKMFTDLEYRKVYRRLDFYKPNAKQLEFHNLMEAERALRAGNQLGKTHAGAAQMAMDSLALYPGWYKGRKFLTPPPIERQHEFVGWAGCTTSLTTRDGIQLKLLGDITQPDGLGRGLIPLDSITSKPVLSRGIADFVDTISLRREMGGSAIIRLKTFEMNRRAWQGEACDEIWCDEDDRTLDEIWGEAMARLTATRGRIFWTATPVLGRTPTRKRFAEKTADRAEVVMGLNDADHIPEAERQTILNRYKPSERATRAFGADMQGEGAVFEIDFNEVQHRRDPATFPHHWKWIFGIDLSHGGMSAQAHPFAAVLCCWDADNDVIYVVDTWRIKGQLPINHAAALRRSPWWDARVAWPGADVYGLAHLRGRSV